MSDLRKGVEALTVVFNALKDLPRDEQELILKSVRLQLGLDGTSFRNTTDNDQGPYGSGGASFFDK